MKGTRVVSLSVARNGLTSNLDFKIQKKNKKQNKEKEIE
jgi:hypothetical protein